MKMKPKTLVKGLVVLLALTLLFVSMAALAFAGPLEDCDLDGYDDHTGAPVPWAGYDETRGDTIPPGWDGKAGSWTGEHSNDGSGAGTAPGSASSGGNGSGSGGNSTGSGSSGSGSSGSGGGAGSGSGSGSSGGGSGVAGGTGGASAADVNTAPTGDGATTGALPVGASNGANTAATASTDTDTGAKALGSGGVSATGSSAQAKAVSEEMGGASATDVTAGTDATTAAGGSIQPVTTSAAGGSDSANATMTIAAQPAIAQPGGIDQDPQTPTDVADTFLKALLVGFSGDNPELSTGLILLGSLLVTGVAAGAISTLRQPSQREVRQSDPSAMNSIAT